jgi:hypothetical protein
MSYLDRPRFHFAGRFQATVSTVNNAPKNFDGAAFGRDGADLGGWNPDGNGAWRLLGCRVTSAWAPHGEVAGDPILAMSVADSDRMAPAKIVDLDPQAQLVSMLFGLEIRVVNNEGATLVRGRFAASPFKDLWTRDRRGNPAMPNDAYSGAMWQSELRGVEWGDLSESPFLETLRASTCDGLLSIKFNVDRYSMQRGEALFCLGRLVGTIGPARKGEPAHMTIGRQLLSEDMAPPINNCVAVLDEREGRVCVDLGNALPTAPDGAPFDLGALALGYRPSHQSHVPPELVSEISYREPGWYERTAGVVDLPVQPLSPAVVEKLASHRLVLVASGSDPPLELIEVPHGLHVGPDERVFRVSAGETIGARLYATKFGKPLSGVRVDCWLDKIPLTPPQPDEPPVGIPVGRHGPEFSKDVRTKANGVAELRVRVRDVGHPRGYLDGQVYGLHVRIKSLNGHKYPYVLSSLLFLHVYEVFKPDKPLAWFGTDRGSIQPIFQQYANLYPVMRRFLDLSSYEDVCRHLDMLALAFYLPVDDPNAMPVTRDLSPTKRRAVLRWLRDRGPDGTGNPPSGTKPPGWMPPPEPLAISPARGPEAQGDKTRALARVMTAAHRRRS